MNSIFRYFVPFVCGAVLCHGQILDSLGKLVNGVPEGWKPYQTVLEGKSGVRLMQDGCFMMSDDGPGEIGIYKDFPAEPGQNVRATVDAAVPKGETDSNAFVLQLTFLARPKNISSSVRIDLSGGSFDSFIHERRVPEGVNSVRVYIYSMKARTGSVLLKNFKLEQSHEALPMMKPIIRSGGIVFEAENAVINPAAAEIVTQDSFNSKRGVALKKGVVSKSREKESGEPDLVFKVYPRGAGRYVIYTAAAVDDEGARLMARTASVSGALYGKIQIGNERPKVRVFFVPWGNPKHNRQNAGKYVMDKEEVEIKVWLPNHVRLDSLNIVPYKPCPVPKEADAYVPKLVPPKAHPRLWCTPATLPKIKENLTHPENKPAWEYVKAEALKPFVFNFDPDADLEYNAALGLAVERKAFYYLMTGDEKIGREAIELTKEYVSRVQFDNRLDICRQIGLVICQTAYVYDWCFGLMSVEERDLLRKHMLLLSEDMECRWPPFGQTIVNGHGNERQVNRDLLSMSIAIYDEDPMPYKYCSYKILEQLVPMRRFEYQSPRHNQGVSYGTFRFGCEMHGAVLYKQMLGVEIFDPNIKDVFKFWMYMRRPDGGMLTDGDGNMLFINNYFSSPLTALLCYAYAGNPIYKAEYFRMGGVRAGDYIPFLFLNEPELKPENSMKSMPLTLDCGPVLGGMIARTGWGTGLMSDEVLLEVRGGGYHFGNHKHADAGSFQIYYRGVLCGAIGYYGFYGRPYDMNFNKRSVAQCMLLCYDKDEKFLTHKNDGGSRLIQSVPVTEEMTRTNPLFYYGKKLSCSFGPSPMKPMFSYFSVDLTGAYSAKLPEYKRQLCFLNLDNSDTPAVIIISDYARAASGEMPQIWQLTSFAKPEKTAGGIMLSTINSVSRKGVMHLDMLLPEERKLTITEGDATNNVFGEQYENPPRMKNAIMGHRSMFEPVHRSEKQKYLSVIHLTADNAPRHKVNFREEDSAYFLEVADRIVVMSPTGMLRKSPLNITVPKGGENWQILVTGLEAGDWNLVNGNVTQNAKVEAERNTLFFTAKSGDKFTLAPGNSAGAAALPTWTELIPRAVSENAADSLYFGKKSMTKPDALLVRDDIVFSAKPVLEELGWKVQDNGETLLVCKDSKQIVFTNGKADFSMNGKRLFLDKAVSKTNGAWNISGYTLLRLIGYSAVYDAVLNSACVVPLADSSILWAASTDNSDPVKLRRLINYDTNNRLYWDAFGKNKSFTLGLSDEAALSGVELSFLQSSTRKAKFAIEVSSDNRNWKRVFEGESSGNAKNSEIFSFEPIKASLVRFVGFGNSVNEWNSVHWIKVKWAEKKE